MKPAFTSAASSLCQLYILGQQASQQTHGPEFHGECKLKPAFAVAANSLTQLYRQGTMAQRKANANSRRVCEDIAGWALSNARGGVISMDELMSFLKARVDQIGAAEESEAQPDAPPALFEFRGMVVGDEHPMPTQQLADPSLYSQPAYQRHSALALSPEVSGARKRSVSSESFPEWPLDMPCMPTISPHKARRLQGAFSCHSDPRFV